MNALAEITKVIYDFIQNNPVVQLILIIIMALLSIDSVHKVIVFYKIEKQEQEEMRRFEEMRKRNENISISAHDNFKD